MASPGRYGAWTCESSVRLHHLRPPPEVSGGSGGAKQIYLLRTNLTENDPALLWQYYTQLVAVEEAFTSERRSGDSPGLPSGRAQNRSSYFHRVPGLLFADHAAASPARRWRQGPTRAERFRKFAAVQMIDVHLPTTDGRELLLTRYTQPEPELRLLIQQLRLHLTPQPPPRIATGSVTRHLL